MVKFYISVLLYHFIYLLKYSQQKEPHLGGSALNTIRILQKMGTNAMFFGAVGNDKRANIVRDLLRKEGLDLK